MRGAVVLRPEPGNTATAARLVAVGIAVLREPLFAVAPVAWDLPDSTRFDALLLTSANAVRHAGPQLPTLRLPVLAVGEATAVAASEAGLEIRLTGDSDAAALAGTARAQGFRRLLHLAGQDRTALSDVEAVTVYRSDPLPLAPDAASAWQDRVALLHSARAARRFAELVDRDRIDRSRVAIAALSPAVREAAGDGWASAQTAAQPSDAALVALAAALIDPLGPAVDKMTR